MISKIYENQLKNQLFKLSLMTIITVIIWIGFATYESLSKSKIGKTTHLQIKPLTASLDFDTIKDIKSREKITKADWDSLVPQLPMNLVLPDIPGTESGQINNNLTASNSGELEK
ncbi:MAG: hypothetical protein U9Q63_03160 [Patescibacteria group bacterium]|nr:hypothetical protein [Patescibacteria group bacterium]